MFARRYRYIVISLVRLTAMATSLLMLTVLIVGNSQAALSDPVDKARTSVVADAVVITDDATGGALFNAAGMIPGAPAVECISLTYSGTLTPAEIRMHATGSGALTNFLDFTVEVGVGGSFGDCDGFVPTSVIYAETLGTFVSTHNDWVTGVPIFTAASNPTSRTLRLTVEVQNDPAAQGQGANFDFTFEAAG